MLWVDTNDRRLGRRARAELDRGLARGDLAVSAISFWEIGTLIRKRRVELGRELARWRNEFLSAGVREIALDGRIGVDSALLDWSHQDPADRIILATAIAQEAMLLTSDRHLLAWSGTLERLDAQT